VSHHSLLGRDGSSHSILADKRVLLLDDEECQRALREILETFIEAGWPAAQHLAYRIDEIHR